MNRPWVVVSALVASVTAAFGSVLLSPPSLALACFVTVLPRDDQRELTFCTPSEPTNTYQDFYAWERLDQPLEFLVGGALATVLMFSARKLWRVHADVQGPDRISGEIGQWLIQSLWRGVRFMTPGTPIHTRD